MILSEIGWIFWSLYGEWQRVEDPQQSPPFAVYMRMGHIAHLNQLTFSIFSSGELLSGSAVSLNSREKPFPLAGNNTIIHERMILQKRPLSQKPQALPRRRQCSYFLYALLIMYFTDFCNKVHSNNGKAISSPASSNLPTTVHLVLMVTSQARYSPPLRSCFLKLLYGKIRYCAHIFALTPTNTFTHLFPLLQKIRTCSTLQDNFCAIKPEKWRASPSCMT